MTKIALITGASRGLGAALAVALAPTHHVVAVARTQGALEDLDDRITAAGGTATLAPMDVTVDGAMQHLCAMIHERWSKVDLWAHTAIQDAPLTPAWQIDDKDWSKSWKVNVEAARRLMAYLAPLLGAEGRAVFFDDPRAGQKFFGTYGATKAAQMALARSWAAESVSTGPQVTIAAPGPMPTALRARFFPGEDRATLNPCADEATRVIAALGLG